MKIEKSGCYDCKHADWYADGCVCELNKCTVYDPKSGCPLHEFGLHSATKYDDGTPIMSEPEKVYCESDADLIHGKVDSACKSALNSAYGKVAEQSNQIDTKSSRPNQFGIDFCEADCCPYWDKYCDHTLQDKHMCPYLPNDADANVKYLEQAFTDFAKVQDEFIEEYDATLRIHGGTLEEHFNKICELEHLYVKVFDYVCKLREKVDKIAESLIEHKGSDFCGNCTHCDHGKQGDNTVYVCDLSHKIVDPDDSSCSMFELPF